MAVDLAILAVLYILTVVASLVVDPPNSFVGVGVALVGVTFSLLWVYALTAHLHALTAELSAHHLALHVCTNTKLLIYVLIVLEVPSSEWSLLATLAVTWICSIVIAWLLVRIIVTYSREETWLHTLGADELLAYFDQVFGRWR